MAAFQRRSDARLKAFRRRLWMLTLAVLIPVVGFGGYVLGRRDQVAAEAKLPVLGAAPAYAMTNQLGQKVASSSLRGKIRIVTFLFPYCTTLCPLIAAHLANLETLGLRPAGIADKVEIVSFNVDPANTGPSQMRDFLRQYGWNPEDPHWQYLTGTPAEVRRVVQNGFGVWYKRVPLDSEGQGGADAVEQPEVKNPLADNAHVDYDVVHNDVLEVVDRNGRIRKIYNDADTVDWADLLRVVESLVGRPA